MTHTVALHETTHAHINDRLNALNLDINVLVFNDSGQFVIDAKPVDASEVDVDYLWMSYHTSGGESKKRVCETALACKSLKVLQTFNAGLDDPYYKKISDRGTRICNSSAQAIAISEYVMAQVLAVMHPVELQREQQVQKSWDRTPFREISRTEWLVVGFGPIAREVVKRAKAFGASTSVIRRSVVQGDSVDRVGTMDDLRTFLPDADIIILACPLNNDTRGFVDKKFFGAVKQDAILVNIARGGLVDDRAMIDSLDSGKLATAVLDVFHEEPLPEDNPLWTHPAVRMTPHTSFSGDGVRDRWDQLFLDNIVRFTNNEPLEQEVSPSDIV